MKKSFLIIIAVAIGKILSAQTQNYCGVPTNISLPPQVNSCCTNNSPAYLNKYSRMQTYIPNINDPVVTVKVTIHLFLKTDTTSNFSSYKNYDSIIKGFQTWYWPTLRFPNSPYLSPLALSDNNDRYSQPRLPQPANYTAPGFNPQPTAMYDSKIRYEVTNFYFYHDNYLATQVDMLLNGYGMQQYNYLNTNYPARLDEGLPLIINSNSYLGFINPNNFKPFVASALGRNDFYFQNAHLLHELGHATGLYHTYDSQTLDCSSTEFLYDVFPVGNTFCISNGGSNCQGTVCYESIGNGYYSNNVMGGANNNFWISKLQMGIRMRTMHLPNSFSNSRIYVKDQLSQRTNPWVIDTNETWDFDIQVYKDILVKTGQVLSVTGKIAMAREGRIIVEKGAKLIVDGGEITTWSKTGRWDGIFIEGSGNGTPQNIVYQGQVEVKNGGTLTNANVAINTFVLDANDNYNWGSHGGIIMCDNANFINNIKDVQYMAYSSQFNQDNIGYFKNCNFKITGALNGGALPDARVSMWLVDGVKFLGCKFENTTGSTFASQNWGIVSADAKYTVDKLGLITSSIKGFKDGIRIENTNPLKIPIIKNTSFVNNYDYGIYANNTQNLIVEDNSFLTPSQVSANGSLYSTGLYLNNCKFYNVRNNTFNKTIPPLSFYANNGITTYNSKTGAHNIYRNSFGNLEVGIIATDDNSGVANINDGLRMNCNDFTIAQNAYDIALTSYLLPPTVDRNQGVFINNNPSLLVRNRYAAPLISSGGEYQFFIENTSAKTYLHATNSNANAKPIPQPDLSDFALFVSGSIPYAAAQCPPTTTPPNPCTSCNKLVNLNSSIANAQIQSNTAKTNFANLIDGGNTATLVAAVNSNMSNGNLKNLLESKSPYLSDAVLTAYFTKSSTPNGHIKDIHARNAPVSASVWQTLQTINLPTGILNQITTKQNEKKVSQRYELDAYVAITTSNLKSAVAEKLNYFATDSLVQSQDSLIKTIQLNAANIDNANEQLFFAYLSANKLKELNSIITIIKASNSDYGNYLEKLVSLNNETSKAYALLTNENLYNYFASVSNNQVNPGSAGAKALLKIVRGINYAEPHVLPDGKNNGARIANTHEVLSETKAENVVTVYPNPTTNNITLAFTNTAIDEEVNVIITDALGRKVYQGNITKASSVQVPFTNLDAGIYILTVYLKNELVQSNKIIKMR